MKTYRVAILGCRARGTTTAQAYDAHPRTEVVALCDLLRERLDILGDELGVKARFVDLDEMIEQTRPDIVAIPTGTEFHHDLALRVLEHGVHIDVEKPLCTNLEEADEVVAQARSSYPTTWRLTSLMSGAFLVLLPSYMNGPVYEVTVCFKFLLDSTP